MKLRKTLLAAMVLSSGVAFGYEAVTDQTGGTEPPRGPGDDSFVHGVYPPGIKADEANRQAEQQSPTDTEAQTQQQTVQTEPSETEQDRLSAQERERISQERKERITSIPQSKGSDLGSQASQQQQPEDQTAVVLIRLDQDRDGSLSRYEAQENNDLNDSFADLDADNDGLLSSEELGEWDGIDTINEY